MVKHQNEEASNEETAYGRTDHCSLEEGRCRHVHGGYLPGRQHKKRIEHIPAYYRVNAEEAKQMMHEGGRKNYLKKNFDKDIDDPLLYDLVVNTDHMPYERAAKIIKAETLILSPPA